MERANYSRIETGKTNPTVGTIYGIAIILKVDMKKLFDI
ncbi:MAG: helix-turn-helix transcriptional regulator [Cytophagales bacterium]|nr:helix-turn-helix transcriptional regulator [Cytophagales bacterium]